MKSTTTPIYVMLVDSDDNPNSTAVATVSIPKQELIESVKEDPPPDWDGVHKKGSQKKEIKKVQYIFVPITIADNLYSSLRPNDNLIAIFGMQATSDSDVEKSPTRSPSNSPDLKRKLAALVEPPATRSKSGIKGSPTKKMAEALQSPVRGGQYFSSSYF